MSTTLKQALERFIDETEIGIYGTAASRSATAITDAPNLANVNWTSPRFKGWWAHIPAEIAVNAVRPMTTLTSAGVLTQGGVNWTTTTELYYRLTRPDWHPTRYLVPLANRALEKAWQWWRTCITMVPDGDMQAATAGSWTGSSSTVTKGVTRTWGAGARSLHIANTGANGYAASTAFETEPNRGWRLTVKAFATTGTPYIAVYDAGGNLLGSVTASPAVLNTWQELSVTGTFRYDANAGTATVRLGGVESNAAIDFADAQLVPEMQTRLTLPSWLTQWRTEQGEEAVRLYRSRNRLGTVGSWPARSYDVALIDPDDFQIIQTPSSLNPIEIEFNRAAFYTGFPLFVEARRPFSDFGTVAADTDTSGCPLRLWVAAMKDLAARERNLTDRLPVWEAEYVREQKRVASKLQTPAPDSRGMAYTVMP